MKNLNIAKSQKVILADHYRHKNEICNAFPTPQFIILWQEEIEKTLVENFKKANYDPTKTLLVFVGQSSYELRYRLIQIMPRINDFKQLYVTAERIYSRTETDHLRIEARVAQMLDNAPYDLSVSNIVVIDDVVSTGITARTLWERNYLSYPNAKWSLFSLVSRLERLKGYEKLEPCVLIDSRYSPINTLSKLVECVKIADEYIEKHSFDENIKAEIQKLLENYRKLCVHTPHVYCFDLYNTLVEEKQVGYTYTDIVCEKSGRSPQDVYSYVRDNLMNHKVSSFEVMGTMLCYQFVDGNGNDYNSVTYSIANAWKRSSMSAVWKNKRIPKLLKRLRKYGHKIVLVTNCTLPSWNLISGPDGVLKEYSNLFDMIFVSSIEGVSKPNEQVWIKIENEHKNFLRNKFVMIGDNPTDDLLVPARRGWKTFLPSFI